MGIGRALSRFVRGILGLGVAALVLIPVALIVTTLTIPILIVLAVAGLVGVGALVKVGIPAAIVLLLAIVAVGALIALAGGFVALGVLALKVVLALMLLSWIFRKVVGRTRPTEPVLVGAPVADIAAPRRDKYDIAAERELDEELGL